MPRYLHKFETTEEFVSAYTGQDYIEPWVSLISESGQVNYNKIIDLEIYYTNDGEVKMATDGARILRASEGIGIVEEIEEQITDTLVGYSYVVNGPYIVGQQPKEELSGTINYDGIATSDCTFSYDTEQSREGEYVWVAPIQNAGMSEVYEVDFKCTFDTQNNVWNSNVEMGLIK